MEAHKTKFILVLFLLALAGCDGDWNPDTFNGQLDITNRTNMDIHIFYDYESEYGFEEGAITLCPDESDYIYVAMDFWDATIVVYYNTIRIEYDISFDVIFETANLTVRVEDFY